LVRKNRAILSNKNWNCTNTSCFFCGLRIFSAP
jgi:hypothetical protein